MLRAVHDGFSSASHGTTDLRVWHIKGHCMLSVCGPVRGAGTPEAAAAQGVPD